MEERGLVEQQTVQVSYRPKIQVALVWLSDDGYRFLREMGLPAPIICEWDRLRLVHNGPQQPVHTAMVVLTAHYMRQRGYHTLVCPTGLDSPYRPDLALFEPQTGHHCYVEVEAPHSGGRAHAERLAHKWRQLVAHQDFAVICALNPEQRQRKIESAQKVVRTRTGDGPNHTTRGARNHLAHSLGPPTLGHRAMFRSTVYLWEAPNVADQGGPGVSAR